MFSLLRTKGILMQPGEAAEQTADAPLQPPQDSGPI